MSFEWDEESKVGLNSRNPAARMPKALPSLDDPDAITIADHDSEPNELRHIALAQGASTRVLVVACTQPAATPRIISARPAAPPKRNHSESNP